MNQLEVILRQIDGALKCFARMTAKVQEKHPFSGLSDDSLFDLSDVDLTELHTTVVAAADSLSPPGSAHQRNVEAALRNRNRSQQVAELVGVLRALRAAYVGGYLATFTQLVRAEVFDDLLSMAEYLLDQGYKDPAAVVAGGVLEEHLRKLCERHGIALVDEKGNPKAASKLNGELAGLAGKEAYGKLDVKSVTAWIDLRNSAAHGHYHEYNAEQVKLMIRGVRDFTARTISRTVG